VIAEPENLLYQANFVHRLVACQPDDVERVQHPDRIGQAGALGGGMAAVPV